MHHVRKRVGFLSLVLIVIALPLLPGEGFVPAVYVAYLVGGLVLGLAVRAVVRPPRDPGV